MVHKIGTGSCNFEGSNLAITRKILIVKHPANLSQRQLARGVRRGNKGGSGRKGKNITGYYKSIGEGFLQHSYDQFFKNENFIEHATDDVGYPAGRKNQTLAGSPTKKVSCQSKKLTCSKNVRASSCLFPTSRTSCSSFTN